MAIYVFKRAEKKYLINKSLKKELIERFSSFVCPDKYHKYTLCNTYYDTEDFELIRRSIEKPDFKEKLRTRCYGIPKDLSPAYIELKRKYDGVVYKRRIETTCGEVDEYLERCKSEKGELISEELGYFCSVYNVFPKMLVAYDREAYCGINDGDLRVTFDSDIRYCTDVACGFDKNEEFERILEDDVCVMEIKANGAVPVEMASVLSELKVYPQPFSKYGRAYIKEKKEGGI